MIGLCEGHCAAQCSAVRIFCPRDVRKLLEDLQEVSGLLEMCRIKLHRLVRSHDAGELREVGPVMEVVRDLWGELDGAEELKPGP